LTKSIAWRKKTQIQQENGISNGLVGAILHAAGKWRTKGGGPSEEFLQWKMNPGAWAVGHRNLDLAKMAQKGKANLIAGPWRFAHEQEMDSTERTQPKTKTLVTAPRTNEKANS
jgi:hypothetical protein